MTTREQALEAALREARAHIITLGGDPDRDDPYRDTIQFGFLDDIDAALALHPDGRVERLCEEVRLLLGDLDVGAINHARARARALLAMETTDAK